MISGPGRQKQGDLEFRVNLGYKSETKKKRQGREGAVPRVGI